MRNDWTWHGNLSGDGGGTNAKKKERREKKGKKTHARFEISSLVVRVSPQNGAQEARSAPEEECSRLVSETRERDSPGRKDDREGASERKESVEVGYRIKGAVIVEWGAVDGGRGVRDDEEGRRGAHPLVLQTMLHIVSIMNVGIGTCMLVPLQS